MQRLLVTLCITAMAALLAGGPARARDAASFTGKLGGKHAVQLMVWFDSAAPPPQSGGIYAYGVYWYESRKLPIALSGVLFPRDGGEWLDLRDEGRDGARQEVFTGYLKPDGYAGEWSAGPVFGTHGNAPTRRMKFAMQAAAAGMGELSTQLSCGAASSGTIRLEAAQLTMRQGEVALYSQNATARTGGGLQRCELRMEAPRQGIAERLLVLEPKAAPAGACSVVLQRSGDYVLARPLAPDGCGCGSNFGPLQVLMDTRRGTCHIHYPDGN